MNYRIPEINDKEILQAYVMEHYENGETSIHGMDVLSAVKDVRTAMSTILTG